MSGTLYIVATPIGNLEDITYRAVRVLKEVDLIACEDTRQTRILTNHFQIDRPMVSYFEHNEAQRVPQILARLREGQAIALVCDAGTPGISDPAFRLVRAARQESIAVVPIPGPCAAIAALSAAGLPTDRFAFEGFLPLKKGRQTRWKELQQESRTIVLYESTHRILKTLKEIHEWLGDRPIVVAREMTKKFEEFYRGQTRDAIGYFSGHSVRGEFVIVISGADYTE